MMDLVFAGDTTSFISSVIFKNLVKELKGRTDIRLAGVVAICRKGLYYNLGRQTLVLSLLRYAAVKLMGGHYAWNYGGDLKRMAKKAGVPIYEKLPTPNKDLALLSVAYPYHIKDVENYGYAVNYHNSLLPSLRGLHSTAFAVYFEKPETGYTYHQMADSFDSGNILIQESIPTMLGDVQFLDRLEAERAADRIGEVLDCIAEKKEGMPQLEGGSEFSYPQWKQFLTVRTTDNYQDVKRKINLFGFMFYNYRGKEVRVTQINQGGKPSRIYYLPIGVYRMLARWI